MWSWCAKTQQISDFRVSNFTFLHSIGMARHCWSSSPTALTIGLPPWLHPSLESRANNSICLLPHVDADLRRRQVKEVANLTQPVLHRPIYSHQPLSGSRQPSHDESLRERGSRDQTAGHLRRSNKLHTIRIHRQGKSPRSSTGLSLFKPQKCGVRNTKTAIGWVSACQLHIPNNFTFGQSKKAIGQESPIGPCIATLMVDNRQACCFRPRRAPSQQRNGTTGKNCFSASPVETSHDLRA
jgi:hypothetical protein